MTLANKEAGEWAVFDSNARQPDPANPGKTLPRQHDARMGVSYPLRYDIPCYMPESDARVFLKDAAFRVLNADGQPVAPLNAEQMSRKPAEILAPNLVVADLGELTDEALLTRVAQMPGGYRYSSAAPREALIDALLTGQTPPDAPPELLADEIDADAVSKMLEGA